jgi:spermidine synthase
VAVFSAAHLDTTRMSSGVYRTGDFISSKDSKMLYYRDGKTATISAVEFVSNGTIRSIRTNGKSDASVQMDPNARAQADEYTMWLAAALPYAINPQARDVANIGFGSGLTTHALLGSPNLARLDTIEIERSMVEGARLFAPLNARAYADPRSHIHVEDAKTFFAAGGRRYDVIVSEPSNPWVSGVSTLFSDEFYGQVRRYLNPNGVFVQWVQAYEINVPLLSSIFVALGRQFGDYAVYRNGPDLFVVATPAARLPQPSAQLFSFPDMSKDLARLGIVGLDDIEALRVGGRAALGPYFLDSNAPANSDYYPILDQRAPRARFKREVAIAFPDMRDAPIPVLTVLDRDTRLPLSRIHRIGLNRHESVDQALAAAEALGVAMAGATSDAQVLSARGRQVSLLLRRLSEDCTNERDRWLEAVTETALFVIPRLAGPDVAPFFERMRASRCARTLDEAGRRRLDLLEASNARDAERMGAAAEWLLAKGDVEPGERRDYITALLLRSVVRGDAAQGRALAQEHLKTIPIKDLNPSLELLLAHLRHLPPTR